MQDEEDKEKFNKIMHGGILFKIKDGIVLRREYNDSKNRDELKGVVTE